MAGLVISGPWLTMLGSRLMARRTSRPAVLIAGRRLSDNPRAAFRAIGGLILAIFVTSVSVGVLTTILDYHSATSGTAASDTLVDKFASSPPPGQPVSTPSVPDSLLTRLRSISGVQGIAVLYRPPTIGQGPPGGVFDALALCDQIASTPAIGRCPAGADVVTITGNLGSDTVTSRSTLAQSVWPAAPITPEQLRNLPVRGIVVQADRSSLAVERTRTVLEVALPGQGPPTTLSEINAASTRTIAELQQLTNAVILISLIIAGCSLAISVTAGVTDRKRPFSLLRLTGVPLTALRRVVALEAGVPRDRLPRCRALPPIPARRNAATQNPATTSSSPPGSSPPSGSSPPHSRSSNESPGPKPPGTNNRLVESDLLRTLDNRDHKCRWLV